jgi:imidazolonepropionase-like amidohydrolase
VTAPVLLEASRLFDGVASQAEARLLVEGGLIRELGGAAPDGVERLQFPDATMLPGLIDAHVHLCFDTSPDPVARLAERNDEAALEHMARAANDALRAGVTTVRDLGARGDLIFRLRERIESGAVVGPHVLAAGRPLTIERGHCWFLGGVARDEAQLLDLVRSEIERGADVIKIMATGGAMTPTSDPSRPQFVAATLHKAVDLAHNLGRPVAAHAHSRAGIRDALAAGVDTLEHGTFVGEDGPRVHDEDLLLMRDTGTVLVPTLIPIAARTRIAGANGGALAPDVSADEFWERRRADVGRLYAAGAHMIAGSDCGVANIPHHAIIDEIACLAAVGMSASAALAAATAQSADGLGLTSMTGRLKPGLRADVLIVEGDPLADLDALRHPLAVFKSGLRVR